DPDWLSRPALDRAFDCMQALDLAFDALVTPLQLPALSRRLERHPQLRCVLDHAGKPPVAHADDGRWLGWIARLAQRPQLHCKLSGLLTLLDPGTPEDAIEPCVKQLFDRF